MLPPQKDYLDCLAFFAMLLACLVAGLLPLDWLKKQLSQATDAISH